MKTRGLIFFICLFQLGIADYGCSEDFAASNNYISGCDSVKTKNSFLASNELEDTITNVAERSFTNFLDNIKNSSINNFGFESVTDINHAHVGLKPIQMYTQCDGENIATNEWRVPIYVNNKMKAFITVDFINNEWSAVSLGAKELANSISVINETIGGSDNNLHYTLVRNYKKMKDYFLIKRYESNSISEIQQKTVLPFPEVIQEQNQWCWAGVSDSIFEYFDYPVEQCEIAEYARQNITWHDFGETNCCVSPEGECNYSNYNWGHAGSIEDILENMQENVTINNYGISRQLSITETQDDLNANHPFIFRWGWKSGGGHFLVGYGYSNQYLSYMDPWFGEGHSIALFDWVSESSSHTWTHTNRIESIHTKKSNKKIIPPLMLLLNNQ